jgi:hypothetical protein
MARIVPFDSSLTRSPLADPFAMPEATMHDADLERNLTVPRQRH